MDATQARDLQSLIDSVETQESMLLQLRMDLEDAQPTADELDNLQSSLEAIMESLTEVKNSLSTRHEVIEAEEAVMSRAMAHAERLERTARVEEEDA